MLQSGMLELDVAPVIRGFELAGPSSISLILHSRDRRRRRLPIACHEDINDRGSSEFPFNNFSLADAEGSTRRDQKLRYGLLPAV